MDNESQVTNKNYMVEILWYFNTGLKDFCLPIQIINSYKKNLKFEWVWRIFSIIEKFRNRKKKYIFIDTKYKSLILGLPRREVLIVGGFRVFIFCIRNGIAFHPSTKYMKYILKLHYSHDSDNNVTIVDTLFKELISELNGFQASVLVVVSDSQPLERLWILASRKTRVLSVCIQHGLFTRKRETLIDGKFADATLVYDEYQKTIVSKGMLYPKNIIPFGYHSDIIMPASKVRAPDKRNVCILGQPWGQYFSDTTNDYLNVIKKIIEVLNFNGIDYVYKFHPGEKNSAYLKQLGCAIFYGDINNAIENYDAFVSLTSTALLEVSLHGRIAIQIFDSVFSEERFDELGYAHLVDKNNLSELPGIIGLNPIEGVNAKFCSGTVVSRFTKALENLNVN